MFRTEKYIYVIIKIFQKIFYLNNQLLEKVNTISFLTIISQYIQSWKLFGIKHIFIYENFCLK